VLSSRLDLLLADASGAPLLEGGLPASAAVSPPAPPRAPSRTSAPEAAGRWGDNTAARDDLAAQRWGIVAPQGDAGDRVLDAVAPLRRLREIEQGAPAKVYRVAPDMDALATSAWKDSVYRAADVPEEERPHYLLLLGDLHHISLDFQQSLTNFAFAGRLAFTLPDGAPDLARYAAYAEKAAALAAKPGALPPAPELLFFCAKDGSAATSIGYDQLVVPCRDGAEQLLARGKLSAAAVREPGSAADFLAAAAGPAASVALTVTHGLGVPAAGAERVSRQGALQIAPGDLLDAERVKSGRLLRGGAWFVLACFGAGTPRSSAYYPWLSRLAGGNSSAGVDRVLACLARGGERPFIAAMPQAALANPDGPLAVVSHVDLAWCYSFAGGPTFSVTRASRILPLLSALVNGSRAAAAFDALVRYYREANDDLTATYQAGEEARALGQPDTTDPMTLAQRWMLRNDLRGYILLGDPAARLQVPERQAPRAA
jgi:hypothetical protein